MKQSQFTKVETLGGDDYIPAFGQENKAIKVDDFLAQARDEIVPTFIYKTIALLQAADLEIDTDRPIYVRCEETGYRLYKITNAAVGVDDISLANGSTASFQEEYSKTGFVLGAGAVADGAMAVFSGTGGTAISAGAVPTNVGNNIVEAVSVSQDSYVKVNSNDSVTLQTISQLKSDLNLPSSTIDELDSKAPLSSPVFTDSPRAPTAPTGDNDTTIANTEFVQAAVSDRIKLINTVADLSTTQVTEGRVYYLKEFGAELAGANVVIKAGIIIPDNVETFSTGTTGLYAQVLKSYAKDSILNSGEDSQEVFNYLTLANDSRLQIQKRLMLSGSSVKIVCLGDSITAESYPATLQTYLRDYYKNNNITVVNRGYSGYRTDQLVSLWNTAVVAEDPDILVHMSGMNDTIQDTGIQQYIDGIYQILNLSQAAGYATILCNVTPHVSTSIEGYDRSYIYKDALFSVAKIFGVRLIDIGKKMQDLYEGYGAISQSLIAADGVHYADPFGREQVAGAIFAYGLCGGDIVVTDGSKFGVKNSKLVIDSNVTKSVNSALCLDFEPVRILPTTFSGAATLYLYLDSRKQCDLVICASREYYNGKTPRCGVLNQTLTGGTIEYFTLGANSASPTSRSIAAPFVACRLKQGLNIIKLYSNDTGTCELFNFNIVETVDNYNKFIESAGKGDLQYSISHDTNTAIKRYISPEKCVYATKKSRICRIQNRYEGRAAMYRMRAHLNSGVILHIGQTQTFSREWLEAIKITLTQNAGNIDAVAKMIDVFGVETTIVSSSIAGTIASDNRFDFFQTSAIFNIYLNGALLISLPFCVGVFDLEITAASGSNCYINPVAELDQDANIFNPIEGECWVTYGATKKIYRRIGGSDLGATIS